MSTLVMMISMFLLLVFMLNLEIVRCVPFLYNTAMVGIEGEVLVLSGISSEGSSGRNSSLSGPHGVSGDVLVASGRSEAGMSGMLYASERLVHDCCWRITLLQVVMGEIYPTREVSTKAYLCIKCHHTHTFTRHSKLPTHTTNSSISLCQT